MYGTPEEVGHGGARYEAVTVTKIRDVAHMQHSKRSVLSSNGALESILWERRWYVQHVP